VPENNRMTDLWSMVLLILPENANKELVGNIKTTVENIEELKLQIVAKREKHILLNPPKEELVDILK